MLQGPIWDVAAKGPTAYPNNLAYVSEFVTTLLATSFPNLRPQQVQVCSSKPVPIGGCVWLCNGVNTYLLLLLELVFHLMM